MTDFSTLLAELDAHWNAVGPLHLEATDEGVDLADAGLRCLAEVPDRLGVTPQARDGIVALVNAYPRLREAIEQLQQDLSKVPLPRKSPDNVEAWAQKLAEDTGNADD